MQNIKYWIWLSILSNKIKLEIIHDLLKKYSVKDIWKLDKRKLKNQGYINYDIEQLTSIENRQHIENYIFYMERNDIKIITYQDKKYPYKLRNIYNPPVVLSPNHRP